MPDPVEPVEAPDLATVVLDLFTQVHDQIRDEIVGLDDAGLNWTPAPGTNSIATVITHVLGSEAEAIRSVAGVVGHRDRDGEFLHPWQTAAEVTAALDRADGLLTEVGMDIDGLRLRAKLSLPTLPPDVQRSGLAWLIGNYGHAREHLGHIQLTRELRRPA